MENTERLISLSCGTGMGDFIYIFKTNATANELKALEKKSNEIYLNGGSEEDVPIWAFAVMELGYTFEYVDERQNVTPYGTSKEWLEEKYAHITEHYEIENQPDKVDGLSVSEDPDTYEVEKIERSNA